MRLWILKPIEVDKNGNPWEGSYDVACGFVVRAYSEEDARSISSRNRGDEGNDAWLDSERTSCNQLLENGMSGLILQDFKAG